MSLALVPLVGCGENPSASLQDQSRFQADSPFVIGTNEAPPLKAPGPGAGEWNSEPASPLNVMIARMMPGFLASPSTREQWGEEAAATFAHYFENTGDDFTVDPARLLVEVPRLDALLRDLESHIHTFALETAAAEDEGLWLFASKEAQSDIITREESENWYLAVNAYSWYVTGRIEKTLGTEPKVEWSWHIWDRYDWDPGVRVPIDTPLGRIVLDQDRVGEFHRQGLAKEFTTVGSLKRP